MFIQNAGVACELVIVDGAFHGFDQFGHDLPVVQAFISPQIEAMKQALGV